MQDLHILSSVLVALLFACTGCASAMAVEDAPSKEESLAQDLPRIPPKSQTDALDTFQLQDGFRLELVACEPLLTDPVAMDYDENGRAFVVEMSDYPYTDKALDRPFEEQASAPIGRIRMLEDSNGDGAFDRSTVFADRLSWPTGLAFWKGGLFVTATPDIWYLKDTDADGRADVRRRVFTGFRKFNVQAVMNNLRWGLDHRIYGGGATNGGEIRPGEKPQAEPMHLGQSDFCFDPVSDAFELVPGGARFGNTFDDWGNRFICNIRNPVLHSVLDNRHLARNPHLPIASAVHDVAPSGDAIPVLRASPPEPWRVINAQRLAAVQDSKTPRSEKTATGFVTSSSGITVYRGAAYPREYYGNVFIGEVAGNLVMRYILSPHGPTFRAARADQGAEFLTSTDNWFRPVNFVNAPDGTLHVLDMYRETIEHPWSIPEDIKAHLDLESGRDRGRIYRLVPPRFADDFRPPPPPRLGEASIEELVLELGNPNSWWRETAHRLLFERQDRSAVAPLRTLLRSSQLELARLHALWSLEGLGALENADLLVALRDSSPGVRRHAVRLAEKRIAPSPNRDPAAPRHHTSLTRKRGNPGKRLHSSSQIADGALLEQIIAAAHDNDIQVRFQAALALGAVAHEPSIAALSDIARRDTQDPWMRLAVLCCRPEMAQPLLEQLLADANFAAGEPARPWLRETAQIIGALHEPKDIEIVIHTIAQQEPTTVRSEARFDPIHLEIVMGLGDGLRRAGLNLTDYAATPASPAGRLLARLLADARRIAANQPTAIETREQAIRILGYMKFDQTHDVLLALTDAQHPPSLQMAAVEALSGLADARVPHELLTKYRALTPVVRKTVVEALLAREDRAAALLDAIDIGTVSAADVPPLRRSLLMESGLPAVRDRARRLFATETPPARRDILAPYQLSLPQPADSSRGEKVFQRECAACHRLGNLGHDVGPNLATVKNRTAGELLVHILDPNREVSPDYLEYVVVTRDGLIQTGMIAGETANALTLRRAENQQETVLRQNIESITSSGKSLMPEGLEKKITPQEMADLAAFMRQMLEAPSDDR